MTHEEQPSIRHRSTLKVNPESDRPTQDHHEAVNHQNTVHPSFEIVKHKSFGTLMHEIWIRFQGEFGLSMLETWEMIMIYIIFVSLIMLFYFAIFKYFPSHIKIIASRAKYYLIGSESE